MADMLSKLSDLESPIGKILETAKAPGVVIQSDDQKQYALLRRWMTSARFSA
jgi:hypothetical protein